MPAPRVPFIMLSGNTACREFWTVWRLRALTGVERYEASWAMLRDPVVGSELASVSGIMRTDSSSEVSVLISVV